MRSIVCEERMHLILYGQAMRMVLLNKDILVYEEHDSQSGDFSI